MNTPEGKDLETILSWAGTTRSNKFGRMFSGDSPSGEGLVWSTSDRSDKTRNHVIAYISL